MDYEELTFRLFDEAKAKREEAVKARTDKDWNKFNNLSDFAMGLLRAVEIVNELKQDELKA